MVVLVYTETGHPAEDYWDFIRKYDLDGIVVPFSKKDAVAGVVKDTVQEVICPTEKTRNMERKARA